MKNDKIPVAHWHCISTEREKERWVGVGWMDGGMERGRDGETAVERRDRERGKDRRVRVKWVFVCGVVAALGRMLVCGADFGGPDRLANVWRVCVCVFIIMKAYYASPLIFISYSSFE